MSTSVLQYQPATILFNYSFPPDIAGTYNAEFDPRHLESYKAGLFEHVDSSLRQMLQELGSSTLHSLHDEACADITGCYQRVLEVSLAETQQLSSQARLVNRGEGERGRGGERRGRERQGEVLIGVITLFFSLPLFRTFHRAPEITYVLCCADLCKDFKEDLEFHFSLGVHRMKVERFAVTERRA